MIPIPAPYALLAALLVGLGAFFYGQHVGYQGRVAEESGVVAKQFQDYATAAGDAARDGTAAALADFNAKASTLETVARQLRTSKGIMDNAASQLSASLRGGACVLNPDQRRLLECVRRPGDAACQAAPG